MQDWYKRILRFSIPIFIFIFIIFIVVATELTDYNNPLTRSITDNLYCKLIRCEIDGGYASGGITLDDGSGWFTNDIFIGGDILSVTDFNVTGNLECAVDGTCIVGTKDKRMLAGNFTGTLQAGYFVGDISQTTGIVYTFWNIINFTTQLNNYLPHFWNLENLSAQGYLKNNTDANLTKLTVENITSPYTNKSYITFLSDGSVGITLDPINLFEPIIPLVYAQEEPQNTVTKTGSTETNCNGDSCFTVLYSGVRFAQDSLGNWVDPSEVLSITKNSDDLTFTYSGIKGDYSITFETGVIYNGNYYSMYDVKQLKPEIQFNFPTKKLIATRKYAVNITDIPLDMQPNINNITLTYKSHSGFTLAELKSEQGKYLIKDIFELVFDDLKENNFIIDINKAEKRIYISNLTFVDNSLYLDPTIKLQEADTENLDDCRLYESLPDNNMDATVIEVQDVSGADFYGVLKFNISSIPSEQQIDEAYLFYYIIFNGLDSDTEGYNVSVHHIYQYPSYNISGVEWNETVITWNNQPNSSEEYNTIFEDTFKYFGGAGEPTGWQSFTVTNMVASDYTNSYNNVSIFLRATDMYGSPATNDYIEFPSKEYATDTTKRPYLNITYSSATVDTTPTITTSLTSPADASTDTDGDITFNCSATPTLSNVTNISLYHNTSGTFEVIETNLVNGSYETSIATGFEKTIANNTHLVWNCLSFNNASNSSFADANYSLTVLFPTHFKNPQFFIQNQTGGKLLWLDMFANMWLGNNLEVVRDLTVDTDTLFVDSTNNKVGIGTTTPTEKLTVIGNINASGNITGNQIYGEMNITGNTVATSIVAQDVWYNITIFGSEFTNGFEFSGGGLIPDLDGLYHLFHTESYSGGANTDYRLCFSIDGELEAKCEAERKLGAGGDIGSSSGQCFKQLTGGQNITLAVLNEDNINDPTFKDLVVTIKRIGD